MAQPLGRGDPRLLGIGEDPQLPLIQAVAFVIVVLIVFLVARRWLRGPS